MKKGFVFGVLLAVLVAFAAFGSATVITGCQAITQSGYYELGNDITTPASFCIDLSNTAIRDIVIDGKGHKIDSGTTNYDGHGIYVYKGSSGYISRNITIKNINVTGYINGIYLNYHRDVVLDNVRLYHNNIGLSSYGVQNITIINSDLSGNIACNGYDPSGYSTNCYYPVNGPNWPRTNEINFLTIGQQSASCGPAPADSIPAGMQVVNIDKCYTVYDYGGAGGETTNILNQSNTYYKLTRDIVTGTAPTGNYQYGECLDVKPGLNNIIIDGQGHSVTVGNGNQGIYILMDERPTPSASYTAKNFIIKNITIIGGGTGNGIYFPRAENITIQDVIIRGFTNGIHAGQYSYNKTFINVNFSKSLSYAIWMDYYGDALNNAALNYTQCKIIYDENKGFSYSPVGSPDIAYPFNKLGGLSCTYERRIIVPVTPICGHSCLWQNQTILSLYQLSNSHVSNASDSNYIYKVCYDEVFGANYTGTNPYSCSGSNTVLRTSSNTNAHAESPTSNTAGYTQLCYGNMQCSLSAENGACPSGTKNILNLSSQTNAHVSMDSLYGYKLCCSAVPLLGAASLQWQDFFGNAITQAGKDWRVRLVFQQANRPDGKVELEIYKVVTGADTGVRTGARNITINFVNGVGVGEWNVAEDYISASLADRDVYIKLGTSVSANLRINSSLFNTAPIANITSPKNKEIYFTGNVIQFNQSSFDREGPIVLNWSDGETSSSGKEFTKSYSTPGQKVITLQVKDISGLVSEDQVSILVLPSDTGSNSYVRPFIEMPRHLQVIANKDMAVSYAGLQSYVVRSEITGNPCAVTVTCLGGSCPTSTSGSPSCTGNSNLITLSGSIGDYTKIIFKWIFNLDGLYTVTKNGTGSSYGSGVVSYPTGGDKVIKLFVNYTDSGISIEDSFLRKFYVAERQCTNNKKTFVTLDSDGKVLAQYNTLNSGACVGADSRAGTADDCCPQELPYCNPTGANPGCYAKTIEYPTCSGYSDALNCSTDSLDAAKNDALWSTLNCGTASASGNKRCHCTWSNIDNKCLFIQNVTNIFNPAETLGSCTYSTEVSACSGGYQTITIKSTSSTGTISCLEQESSFQAPCARPAVQLSVFGWTQLIGALIIIVIIYLIVASKGKKKKRR